ncbi:hypothetical protein HYW32_00185 [Candidatus Berkelbacteria bacterium]|nr:hypothetical protein [Candidatus Berkelbacteria bacterium]
MGLGSIAWVGPEIEPSGDAEGEVGRRRWVSIGDLEGELKEHPEHFMGFHYPVLLWAVNLLRKPVATSATNQ